MSVSRFSGGDTEAGTIRVIVPYIIDGGTGKRSQLLARYLGLQLGRPVRAISIGGAVAGHEAIASARPDGETLGMITGEIGMMHWHEGVTSLTWRSYTPLAVPFVEAAAIIVRADAPWKSLEDFLEAIRTNKLRGSGSPDFGVWKFALLGLVQAAGIDCGRIVWVPTASGEEGIAKLVGGEVEVAPVPMVEAPELIFAGRIRPLATMAEARHPLFPDVPTVREAVGLDWQVAHWRGLVAPAGLAREVEARLVTALRQVAADPAFMAESARNGYSLGWRFGADFAQYMREDDAQFGRLIRAR